MTWSKCIVFLLQWNILLIKDLVFNGDININQKSIFMEPRLTLNLISPCLILQVQELKGASPLNNNSGAYDIGIVTVESVLVAWDFSQQKSSYSAEGRRALGV